MVSRYLHHGHVAEHALRGHEAELLVQNTPHVLVSGYEALHQDVALALAHHLHGDTDAVHIHILGYDGETGHVDALGLAYLFDFFRIADQRGIHNTCLNGIIDSFERVRILSVSYDEPTFSPRLSLGYEVI